MGNNASKDPVLDEDFPSLQEAAMLARGVKIDEQRKRNSTPKQAGNVSYNLSFFSISFPKKARKLHERIPERILL